MSLTSSSNIKNELNALRDSIGPTISLTYSSEISALIDLSQCELMRTMWECWEQEIKPRSDTVVANYKDGAAGREIVTDADLAVSRRLLAVARKYFPDSYSEEERSGSSSADYLWQFDPIDGTECFFRKMHACYGISAALLRRASDGRYHSVVGMILLPGLGKLWSAGLDGTLRCYDAHGELAKPDAAPNSIKERGTLRAALTSIYIPKNEMLPFYQGVARELGVDLETKEFGGAASLVAAIISGEVDLSVLTRPDSKEWDVGMSIPLVKAAGGFTTDLNGAEFTSLYRAEPCNLDGVMWARGLELSMLLALKPRDFFRAQT